MGRLADQRQAAIEERENSIPSSVRSFLGRVQARDNGAKILIFGLGVTWIDTGSTSAKKLEGIPELEGQNLADCAWFLDELIAMRLRENEQRRRLENPRYAGMPGVGWM